MQKLHELYKKMIVFHHPVWCSQVLEAHCANPELIYEPHRISGARAWHKHSPWVIKKWFWHPPLIPPPPSSPEAVAAPAPHPRLSSNLRCWTYAHSFSQFGIHAVRHMCPHAVFKHTMQMKKLNLKRAAGWRVSAQNLHQYADRVCWLGFSRDDFSFFFFTFSAGCSCGFFSCDWCDDDKGLRVSSLACTGGRMAVQAGWLWENAIYGWMVTRLLSLSN